VFQQRTGIDHRADQADPRDLGRVDGPPGEQQPGEPVLGDRAEPGEGRGETCLGRGEAHVGRGDVGDADIGDRAVDGGDHRFADDQGADREGARIGDKPGQSIYATCDDCDVGARAEAAAAAGEHGGAYRRVGVAGAGWLLSTANGSTPPPSIGQPVTASPHLR